MPPTRVLIHGIFVLLLPLIVAAFGLSVTTTAALVLAALIWRWLIVLAGLRRRPRGPGYELETISASHFVEKVRWCMDRLGLEYVEKPWVGTLGVFYKGRSVPQLFFQTGLMRSSIGNSAEILRYLWGVSAGLSDEATFLEPTPERLELERRLDRYGVDLQIWVYYHLLNNRSLDNRDVTLHVWGVDNPAIPAWQRRLIRFLYPLQAFLIKRAFRLDRARYEKSLQSIEVLLEDMDTRLADGRVFIEGGETMDFTDIAFAAMCGVWLQPEAYGGGKAEAVRLHRERMPRPMQEDIRRWTEDYPRAVTFVERLYAKHRLGVQTEQEEPV